LRSIQRASVAFEIPNAFAIWPVVFVTVGVSALMYIVLVSYYLYCNHNLHIETPDRADFFEPPDSRSGPLRKARKIAMSRGLLHDLHRSGRSMGSLRMSGAARQLGQIHNSRAICGIRTRVWTGEREEPGGS
jgi:hypothetical protein